MDIVSGAVRDERGKAAWDLRWNEAKHAVSFGEVRR